MSDLISVIASCYCCSLLCSVHRSGGLCLLLCMLIAFHWMFYTAQYFLLLYLLSPLATAEVEAINDLPPPSPSVLSLPLIAVQEFLQFFISFSHLTPLSDLWSFTLSFTLGIPLQCLPGYIRNRCSQSTSTFSLRSVFQLVLDLIFRINLHLTALKWQQSFTFTKDVPAEI